MRLLRQAGFVPRVVRDAEVRDAFVARRPKT
jgi:hypothetical protein